MVFGASATAAGSHERVASSARPAHCFPKDASGPYLWFLGTQKGPEGLQKWALGPLGFGFVASLRSWKFARFCRGVSDHETRGPGFLGVLSLSVSEYGSRIEALA